MKRKKLSYYINKFMNGLQYLMEYLYNAVSFILIACNLFYIIYYQFVDYYPFRTIVGCVSLITMIYLNKSL